MGELVRLGAALAHASEEEQSVLDDSALEPSAPAGPEAADAADDEEHASPARAPAVAPAASASWAHATAMPAAAAEEAAVEVVWDGAARSPSRARAQRSASLHGADGSSSRSAAARGRATSAGSPSLAPAGSPRVGMRSEPQPELGDFSFPSLGSPPPRADFALPDDFVDGTPGVPPSARLWYVACSVAALARELTARRRLEIERARDAVLVASARAKRERSLGGALDAPDADGGDVRAEDSAGDGAGGGGRGCGADTPKSHKRRRHPPKWLVDEGAGLRPQVRGAARLALRVRHSSAARLCALRPSTRRASPRSRSRARRCAAPRAPRRCPCLPPPRAQLDSSRSGKRKACAAANAPDDAMYDATSMGDIGAFALSADWPFGPVCSADDARLAVRAAVTLNSTAPGTCAYDAPAWRRACVPRGAAGAAGGAFEAQTAADQNGAPGVLETHAFGLVDELDDALNAPNQLPTFEFDFSRSLALGLDSPLIPRRAYGCDAAGGAAGSAGPLPALTDGSSARDDDAAPDGGDAPMYGGDGGEVRGREEGRGRGGCRLRAPRSGRARRSWSLVPTPHTRTPEGRALTLRALELATSSTSVAPTRARARVACTLRAAPAAHRAPPGHRSHASPPSLARRAVRADAGAARAACGGGRHW